MDSSVPIHDTTAIFAWMESILINPLNKSMDDAIANLSSNLKTPSMLMAVIMITFYGIRMMYGRVDFVSGIFILCKIAIITLLVTNASNFNYYVKDVLFDHLPNGISQAIASKQKLAASSLDQVLIQTNEKITAIRDEISWKDISSGITCFFILLIVGFLCVIAFAIQGYAKLGLAIIISIGPLFICLYMWDSTKRFTEAWISQAANFIILQILVSAFLSVFVELIIQVIQKDWSDAFAMLVPIFVVCLVASAVIASLPSIASALSGGGASLSTAGIGRNLKNTAKGIAAAAKGLGKAMSGAARLLKKNKP